MSSVNRSSIKRGVGVYQQNILTKKIKLPYNSVGSNILENIQLKLIETLSGKCIKGGYVKTGSIQVLSHSAGVVKDVSVEFVAVFQCLICNPVEGQRIRTIVKNITKAGARCETMEDISPVVVFIARDHNFKNKNFANLKNGDPAIVRVIGTRFELNDSYISVIGELVSPKKIRRTRIVVKQ
jgi:DNA-directed RNA polymerase subunit E'/Rpb7